MPSCQSVGKILDEWFSAIVTPKVVFLQLLPIIGQFRSLAYHARLWSVSWPVNVVILACS